MQILQTPYQKFMEKTPKWIYNGAPLTEPPDGAWGFLYMVRWSEGYYIGQKSFWSVRNTKISKKRATEIYSGRGPKKKKEKVQKESDWRTYKTSSKEVKELVGLRGENAFEWIILDFAVSKTDLTYKETQYILCHDCLKDERCYNNWVTARIHKNNL